MYCPNCNREIPDNARFCRYCGRKTDEPVFAEEWYAVPDTAGQKPGRAAGKKRVLAAVIIAAVCLAAAAVCFLQVYRSQDCSAGVKRVDLESVYMLEDDAIDLDSPTASYADGRKGRLSGYTAYLDGQKCKVKEGRVCLPSGYAPGKHTLRLEWENENDGTKEYCQKDIKVREKKQKAAKAAGAESGEESGAVNTVGNTVGNLQSEGRLAQQGKWLYYMDDGGIYKAAELGVNPQLLCDDVAVTYINVVGDWIYYQLFEGERGIYRMKTDGSERTCIFSEDDSLSCQELVAMKDKIFFRSGNPMEYDGTFIGDIYVMNPDGTDRELFLEGECTLLGIEEGYLYYTEGNSLRRILPSGEGMEVVCDDYHPVSKAAIEDGWLYYAAYVEGADSGMLSRLNLESGEIQPITDVMANPSEWEFSINIKDGWIYYMDIEVNYDTGEMKTGLAKITADGSGYEYLMPTEGTDYLVYPFVTKEGVVVEKPTYSDMGLIGSTWTEVD